jgi:hypothetical protein
VSAEALARYRELAARLEALWQAGLGESEEAEALRNQMDPVWSALTEAEHDLLRREARANP